MRVETNICDHKKCRRKAVEAYDVVASSGFPSDQAKRHYEVCEKHAALFNGGGWLRSDVAERIKRELVPS